MQQDDSVEDCDPSQLQPRASSVSDGHASPHAEPLPHGGLLSSTSSSHTPTTESSGPGYRSPPTVWFSLPLWVTYGSN